MSKHLGAVAVLFSFINLPLFAGPLEQAEVTKIINQVSVVEPRKGERPAALRDVIKDDLGLETGKKSRSELLFQDDTLTRLGAETYFSFKTGTRDMTLEKGSMLLQVPKGLGGATIHTAAVTAAITGTTIMIEYVPDQYIKVLVLEGSLRLSRNGRFGDSLMLHPGKMVIMKPDAKRIPDPVDVDLAHLVKTSTLVNFPGETLPSMPLIQQAIDAQQNQLAKNELAPTNLVIGNGTNVTVVSGDPMAMPVITRGTLGATLSSPVANTTSSASIVPIVGTTFNTLGDATTSTSALAGNLVTNVTSTTTITAGVTLNSTAGTVVDTLALVGSTTGTVANTLDLVLGSTTGTVTNTVGSLLTSTVSGTTNALDNLVSTGTTAVGTLTSGVLGSATGTLDSATSTLLSSTTNVVTPVTSALSGVTNSAVAPITSTLSAVTNAVTSPTSPLTSVSVSSSTQILSLLSNATQTTSGIVTVAPTTVTSSPTTTIAVASTAPSATTSPAPITTATSTTSAVSPNASSIITTTTSSPTISTVVSPTVTTTTATTSVIGTITSSPTTLLTSSPTSTTTSPTKSLLGLGR